MNYRRLISSIHSDTAENSIMQTITIAVSAILIAAGLVTAPGMINNARDNNARTDLDNIAFAQESYLGDTGKYFTLKADNSPDVLTPLEGVKYTLSGNVAEHKAWKCDAPNASYLISAKSSSGKVFYRASTSSVTTQDILELNIPACLASQIPSTPANPNPTVPTVPEPTEPTVPTNPEIPFASYLYAMTPPDGYMGTIPTYTSNLEGDVENSFPWFSTIDSSQQTQSSSSVFRVWVGDVEVPIDEYSFRTVYIFADPSEYMQIDISQLAPDFIAAGFTMEDFMNDGWMELSIWSDNLGAEVPGNYFHVGH